jgi:hypothetical protein
MNPQRQIVIGSLRRLRTDAGGQYVLTRLARDSR